MKTWQDVEIASLTCPYLRMAVTKVRQGQVTREEALTIVALALAEARQRLMDAEVKRLMEMPAKRVRI